MRSSRWVAALGLYLGLAGACGRVEEEEEEQNQDCLDYCAEIAAACPAGTALAQYPAHGKLECLDYCDSAAAFALGTKDESSGNTLECRRTHARLALTDPAAHCLAAGPSGGNVCGSWCENYCALALRNCTGGSAFFPDAATCLATCAGFPQDGPFATPFATMSDSVQCRLMEAAEASKTPTCCAHAAPASTACL